MYVTIANFPCDGHCLSKCCCFKLTWPVSSHCHGHATIIKLCCGQRYTAKFDAGKHACDQSNPRRVAMLCLTIVPQLKDSASITQVKRAWSAAAGATLYASRQLLKKLFCGRKPCMWRLQAFPVFNISFQRVHSRNEKNTQLRGTLCMENRCSWTSDQLQRVMYSVGSR